MCQSNYFYLLCGTVIELNKKEPSTTRFKMLMTYSYVVSTRTEKSFINFTIL
jgi:hypothetical protein